MTGAKWSRSLSPHPHLLNGKKSTHFTHACVGERRPMVGASSMENYYDSIVISIT